MNLLIKSSIIILLAAVSGAYASGVGEQTGIQAANDIVDQHWCLNQRRNNRNRISDREREAREVAIRTCQSATTIRKAINDLCPNDGTPSNRDIFDLGNRCSSTVDRLIGRPPSPTPRPTRPPTSNNQCKRNRDCPGSQICNNRGRCVRRNNSSSSSSSSSSSDDTNTCRRNNDCRSGQRCNDTGRCVRNSNRQPRSGQRCTKRSDCGPHRFCGSNSRCQRQDMEFEEFMEQY